MLLVQISGIFNMKPSYELKHEFSCDDVLAPELLVIMESFQSITLMLLLRNSSAFFSFVLCVQQALVQTSRKDFGAPTMHMLTRWVFAWILHEEIIDSQNCCS